MQVASNVDLFPTVMNIAGASLPDVTLDGVDMSPILFEDKPVNTFLHIPLIKLTFMISSPRALETS